MSKIIIKVKVPYIEKDEVHYFMNRDEEAEKFFSNTVLEYVKGHGLEIVQMKVGFTKSYFELYSSLYGNVSEISMEKF